MLKNINKTKEFNTASFTKFVIVRLKVSEYFNEF